MPEQPAACDCHLHEQQVCDVCQAVTHRPGYLRYGVAYSKRDWPLRPWRWKRVRKTRYMRIGGKS